MERQKGARPRLLLMLLRQESAGGVCSRESYLPGERRKQVIHLNCGCLVCVRGVLVDGSVKERRMEPSAVRHGVDMTCVLMPASLQPWEGPSSFPFAFLLLAFYHHKPTPTPTHTNYTHHHHRPAATPSLAPIKRTTTLMTSTESQRQGSTSRLHAHAHVHAASCRRFRVFLLGLYTHVLSLPWP